MAQITNLIPNKLHPITGEDLKPTIATLWRDGVTSMSDSLCGGLYNKDTESTSPTFGSYFKWNSSGIYPISRLTSVNQSNLQKLINDFGSNASIILLDKNINITSNIEIPTNIRLIWADGVIISTSSGITLTIRSSISEGNKQLFSGLGNVVLNTNSINAVWFGLKTEDGQDNTSFLQKAIDTADVIKCPVILPEGNITLKRQLRLRNIPLKGTINKTVFIFPTDFVYTESIDGRKYSTILNNDFQGQKTINANTVYLEGIIFDYREDRSIQTTITDPSIIGLANVSGGYIKDCTVLIANATGSLQSCTGIDLWSGVSNFNISNVKVYNRNQSVRGGAIWIRNISIAGNLSTNDTHNIKIDNVIIEHATKDEPLAVYGVRGVSRDININKVYIKSLTSTQARSVLVSVFPLNDGSTEGLNAAIKNVTITNCTFEDDYFTTHILRLGQSGLDEVRTCDNIVIDNNTFITNKSITELSYIARQIKNIGTNTFINNTINVIGTGIISYGVGGFDKIDGNTIKGNIENGIYFSREALNNTIDVTGVGVCDTITVIANTIKSVKQGMLTQYRTNVSAKNNTIAVSGAFDAIVFQSVSGSAPGGEVSSNEITMNSAANYVIRKSGIGDLTAKGNISKGLGKPLIATNGELKEVSSNNWFGNKDNTRDTLNIDTDYINAVPKGTMFFKENRLSSDGVVGYFKRLNTNQNSNDWSAIFNNPFNAVSGSNIRKSDTEFVSGGGFIRNFDSHGLTFDGTNFVTLAGNTNNKTVWAHDNNKLSAYVIPSSVAPSTNLTYSDLQQYLKFEITTEGIKTGSVWNSKKLLQLGTFFIWLDSENLLRIVNGVPSSDKDGKLVGIAIPSIVITATTAQAEPNRTYITDNAARVTITLTLESSVSIGDRISIRGRGTGGWRLAQNALQTIHGLTTSTVGVGGYVESGARYDTITVEKINTNEWTVVASTGTLTIV